MHAMVVIMECRNDTEEFIDNLYMIETYMSCYNSIMKPINGMRFWHMLDVIPLSWTVLRKGKRQKDMRKGAEEEVIVHS